MNDTVCDICDEDATWGAFTSCCHMCLCEEHLEEVMVKCSKCEFDMCDTCNNINHMLFRCHVCREWTCEWCDEGLKEGHVCTACTRQ